ncbi:hypothetical protein ACOZ4N_00270 (plasmid) [Halorientalis pallida]|uniref:hypothetical protein n=1 Tax=Halorientalis pallida TaxID=2479928 RepID=UPI003C6FA6B8
MLPGFERDADIVGSKVDFDPIRLEQDETIVPDGIGRGGRYRIADDCIDSIKDILHFYYDRKPGIREFSWGGAQISFRAYNEDIEPLCKLIAAEMVIAIETGFFDESSLTEVPYSEVVESGDYSVDVDSVSLDDILDFQADIEEEIDDAIPDGLSNIEFSNEQYNKYFSEHIHPVVSRSNWKGGNAWLINSGIGNLRNGRYQSAAYCFEGARIGLTKHSLFNDTVTRLSKIVDRALNTLRELCRHQSGTSGSPRGIELFCELENRDLLFIPEFTQTPGLFDQNFRLQNQIWIANALVLLFAVASAMDPPMISRSEVDEYGSNLTVKNRSFVLKVAKKLYDLESDTSQQSGSQDPLSYLDSVEFEALAPEITLTRILSDSGFTIRTYSDSSLGTGDERIDLDHDFVVEQEESLSIVRALRAADRSTETIRDLVETLQSSQFDHNLILLFESELDEMTAEYCREQELVEVFYVNMREERMSHFQAGFPPSFEDYTTSDEVHQRISELYSDAEDAETTEDKGNSLERLMQLIFEKAVPDTQVRGTNVRTRVEEIDLQLTSNQRQYPWTELGSPINVECKNWSDTAGVDVIYTAFGKARATSPDCKGIILVCWEGISDSYEGRNGDQAIREIRGKGVNILTLDKDDLQQIAETGDAQAVFEEKADELWDR